MSRGLRLPSAPLVALVESRGGACAIGWFNGTTAARAYSRAKTRGWIYAESADALAIALRVHPIELWPDEWLAAS